MIGWATARNLFKIAVLIAMVLSVCSGCAKAPEEESPSVANPEPASQVEPRYLYVASGVCNSGGNTTFTNLTSSNLIYRLNLADGSVNMTLADYFASPSNAGDSPASIVDADSDYIYALIENTTTTSLRRIEKIEKKSHINSLENYSDATYTKMTSTNPYVGLAYQF